MGLSSYGFMNELIWFIVSIMSIVVLSLIGIGLSLMWRDRAKKAKSSESWGDGSPSFKVEMGQRPKARTPLSAGSGGCFLIFGLFWTVFSLAFVILPVGMFFSEMQTYNLLKDTGDLTEGVITSRRIDEDSEGDTYYVTYKYTAPLPQGDRQQFSHEESVSSSLYESLEPETRVQVRYARANPEVAELEQEFGPPAYWILLMSGMGGLFTLIGLFMMSNGLRSIGKAGQLARQGQVTQGLVVDRWTEKDSDGDTVYVVAYRFNAPGHPPVTIAEYFHRGLFDKLQMGAAVPVRYLPDKPQTCRLEL
jgi:hypothetical protein